MLHNSSVLACPNAPCSFLRKLWKRLHAYQGFYSPRKLSSFLFYEVRALQESDVSFRHAKWPVCPKGLQVPILQIGGSCFSAF